MQLTSYEPFWLLKNGLLSSYPSLQENIETDIVVVGAGITGSLIAHQCNNLGFDTVLIDKREIANGSTSASTCMLQYEIDVPLYQLIEKIGIPAAVSSYKACSEAIDKLGDIVSEIQSDCGFKKKQSLYFASSKKHKSWLYKEYKSRLFHGFKVKWLDAEEINTQFGITKSFGGILSDQAASFDAFHFTHDLLKFNSIKGLKVFDKTAIAKVEEKKDGLLISTESKYQIKAKKVIYCTGFEVTELIKEDFVSLLNTYAIAGEQQNLATNQLLKDTLFWDTGSPYHYWRTTDDGRLLIGGEDVKFSTPKKKLSLVNKKTKKLTGYIQKTIPNYPFQADFSWCGTFGSTKDGLPYIGVHRKFPKSYFVLGFGGNGITFSVHGMDMVADWLNEKTNPLEKYFKFGR